MNRRESQGVLIAAKCKITKKGGIWLVPSQSGDGIYTVCPDTDQPHCTCPDHQKHGGRCKHIYAAEFARMRDESPAEEPEPPKPKTYPQNWRAYNAAQTNEKDLFQKL